METMTNIAKVSKLVGVTKSNDKGEDIQSILERLKNAPGNMALKLEREPDNPFDENAIKVLHGEPTDEYTHIGYVNRDLAKVLAPLIDSGADIHALLLEIIGGGDGLSYGCKILITGEGPEIPDAPNKPEISMHAPPPVKKTASPVRATVADLPKWKRVERFKQSTRYLRFYVNVLLPTCSALLVIGYVLFAIAFPAASLWICLPLAANAGVYVLAAFIVRELGEGAYKFNNFLLIYQLVCGLLGALGAFSVGAFASTLLAGIAALGGVNLSGYVALSVIGGLFLIAVVIVYFIFTHSYFKKRSELFSDEYYDDEMYYNL